MFCLCTKLQVQTCISLLCEPNLPKVQYDDLSSFLGPQREMKGLVMLALSVGDGYSSQRVITASRREDPRVEPKEEARDPRLYTSL